MGEGLQRAAMAAKRTNYPGTPEPAILQVWEDCSRATRQITITGFSTKMRRVWHASVGLRPGHYEATPYRAAVCSVVIGDKARKGTVSIDVVRFVPNKNGFRYMRTEAP